MTMEIVGNDAQFNEKVTLLKDLEIYGNIKNKTKDTSLDFSDNLSFKIQGKEKLRITSDSTTFTDTVTAPSGNFSGIVTATKFSGTFEATTGSFSGDVSIGGTLTYEDVTNVDSIGIITARTGVNVNNDTGVGVTINKTGINVVGVVTATSFTGDGSGLSHTVPTGAIIMWSGLGSNVPTGYLLCDGSAISRTTYATLFGIITISHGLGDGSSTFNIPNLIDRFVVGADTSSGDTSYPGLSPGATGGSADATLPSHYHNYPGDDQLGTANGVAGWSNLSDGSFSYDAVSNLSGGGTMWRTSTKGSSATNANLPPYYALCYIIKT